MLNTVFNFLTCLKLFHNGWYSLPFGVRLLTTSKLLITPQIVDIENSTAC